jgi:hypothetical protein
MKLHERLFKLVQHDIRKYGKRRSFADYAIEIYGDPNKFYALRSLMMRVKRNHPELFLPSLTATEDDVPTDAHGANRDAAPIKPSLAEFIEHAKAGTALHKRTAQIRQGTEIFVKTSRPICVANMADFHLGGAGADHAQWADDYEYLLATPHLYAVFNGDLIENCISFPDQRGVVTQVLSPEEQDELIYQALEALEQKHKVLAVTAGNHDHLRDARLVGRSFMAKSCARLSIPFFHGFGVVTLLVGQKRETAQRYSITISHAGLGHSMYNKVHGAGRLWLKTLTDIVFTAHKHQPCIAMDFEHGRIRVLAQAGTLNTEAEYAMYKYKSSGTAAWPTVVLRPDRHHIDAYMTPRAAVEACHG